MKNQNKMHIGKTIELMRTLWREYLKANGEIT